MARPDRAAGVKRERLAFEALEPRLLYSADLGPSLLAAALVSPVAEHRLLDSDAPPPEATSQAQQQGRARELVFVDAAAPDPERLIADIAAQQRRALEVVRIGAEEDGLARIGAELAARQDLWAVHIISHGADGAVHLGRSVLDLAAVGARAGELAAWGASLTEDADLLVYGCDVAQTEAGRILLQRLAALTGADVAASVDPTGSAALGGDWHLEYASGAVEAQLAISPQAQGEWVGLLASVAAGGEIQVNTTLGGNQTEASVAMDSNGNFVVVWTADGNLDGDGKGVFAQRFDASGNKLGGEVRVNTTTAKDQMQAAVAMDPSGNYVVVWMSDNQDPGANDGIYAQRYNSSGVAQGGEFRVNDTAAGNQVDPSVAMDASGNFTVVWTSNQNGNLDVFARQYNAAGVALAAEFLVNTTPGGNQSDADVAMDSSGNFVVVWSADGNLDGNDAGIFARRFDAAGNPLGGEVRVNTITAKDQTQASVAMTPGGDYVVAWTSDAQDGDRNGVFAQRFSAAGVAQGGEFRVNTQTADAQDSPAVAIDAAGRFTVTWQSNNQDGSNKGVFAQSYDAAGFRIGAEFRVNATTANAQSLPSIAMRGNGNFVVAWQGQSAADSSGVAARLYSSLNQAPVNVVPGAQVAGGAPHVFSTALGNAIQVTDVDGGGAVQRVTLTATNGTLTLGQTAGLVSLSGNGTASVTFDGTLAAINAALDGMSFTATQNFSGAASVQIVSSDLGATGAGGPLTDTDTVNITVAAEGTPFILSGSYTGNAADNRAITGLGFTPDVVIIKVRDDNKVGVIRTSTMAGDVTKELTGGTALVANEIQSLDGDGFTLGTSDRVNSAGKTYDWIAFKTSPGFLTVGAYSGDSSAGRTVTGLGFSPDALFVFDAGNQEAVFTNSAAGGNAFDFNNSTNATWIPSLDANGFTVGADNRVNGLGRTYHYVAWNEVPGLMDVGSYAGNSALDDRDIAGVGFQPEWVVVKNTAGGAVVQHFDSQGAAADSSSFFTGNAANTNRIQQLQADGFQVGTDNDVNDSGRTYTYMAFRQETAPTISNVADQATAEGTPTAAIAFTVGDAETGAGSLTVVASSSDQTLVPDASIVIGGSGAARTVTITPAPDQYGTVTITLRVSDGFAVASDTFVLTVNPFNDAPTVSAPAEIGVNEDEASPLVGIAFADPDAGTGSLQATFTVPQGTLSAASGAGVTVGGTSTSLTLTGTLGDINAFIAAGSLDYRAVLDDLSSVTLGVSINDLGNAGAGGPQFSGTTNVTLNVTAIDDAPQNAVPGAQSTATDTPIVFSTGNGNAISISDVDAGAAELEITLSVAHGTLTLSGTAGLTFSAGTGTADATMTFRGTLADANAALQGLRYDPTTSYSGPDALDVTTNDLGNTGSGGPWIVTNTVVINVNFVNAAPVLAGANNLAAIDEDPAADPGTLVSALIAGQVTDADSSALAGIAVIAVDNTDGAWEYSLNGGGGWSPFGSPSAAAARLLAADGNTYVRFVPNADFNGAVTNGLTFRAWDRTSGLAGATADTTTNGGGSAYSAATAASGITVNAVNDAPAGVPTITGTVTEDQALSANTAGISDVDGLGAFSYQWLRDGGTIAGAVGSTYTLGDADVGAQISVQVSYTDAQGAAESVASAQTAAVAGVNDAPAGLPTIGGTVAEDQLLSADTTGISDADGLGAFSYQWLGNGVPIAGASASTYTPGDADVGTQISVRVSYTDGQGTAESVTSAQTAAVANVNDAPAGVPTIGGTVAEDQLLSADTTGINDADGLGAFGYQWLRNGGAIAGATGSTYTLGDADVGAQISVQVSYTDAQGTPESVTSAQTAAVANVNDAPAGAPAIAGTVREDQTLTADTSGLSDADGLGAFSYQWLNNGGVIAGATASTYTLGDADVGAQISVRVSYTDARGTAEGPLTSAQSVAVANVNDAPAGSSGTVTTLQDTAYVFAAADFGFTDAEGNTLATVRIATLPAAGTLTDNAVPVSAGQFVSVANIAGGLLRFTPAAGASGAGYASFTFQVQDDGGTANGGANLDPVARVMSVNVTAAPVVVVVSEPEPLPAIPPPTSSPPAPLPGDAASPSASPAAIPSVPLTVLATTGHSAAPGDSTLVMDGDEGFQLKVSLEAPLIRSSAFAAAQRLTAGSIAASLLGVPAGQMTLEERPLDFTLLGLLSVSNSTGGGASGSQAPSLADELNRMREELTEQAQLEHWVTGSIAVGSFGLTVGYALWLLRGGALLASLLSSLPAWRLVDPLPVLARVDDDEADGEDDEHLVVSFAGERTPERT